jgi:hypothetical protein
MKQGTEVLAWMRGRFNVDPKRGLLRWRLPPANHPRLMGLEAGSFSRSRNGKVYCVVKMDRVALKRGRLIFLWVHSRWPQPCLDHIDGNSINDSIANLREATVTQNSWNHKGRKKASPLPMGVRSLTPGRFQARLAVNKTMLHLGVYDSAAKASAAYQRKRREVYGEFA